MLRNLGTLPSCGFSLALTLTLISCGGARGGKPVSVQPPPLDLRDSPPASADRLYAQLWMETSPEYRAVCLQTFNSALREIRSTIQTAARVNGLPVGSRGKRLAVVADLDETILDTSGYQAQLVLKGVEYTPETWARWVNQGSGTRLVPGALEFLTALKDLGLVVVFISNRSESLRGATVRTLADIGIETGGLKDEQSPRLLLRQNDSGKESRRQRVLGSYEVVAFIGDSINDFPGFPGDADPSEKVLVERQLWGRSWFLLPNPVYGSWTDRLREKGPRQTLRDLHPDID